MSVPSTRPMLHLWGSRDEATNIVCVCCRCTDLPRFAVPIIALFVCRDVLSEADKFKYLGQSRVVQRASGSGGVPEEEEGSCAFQIADCPQPLPPQPAPSEEDDLEAESDLPKPVPAIAQLKFIVYNTAGATSGASDTATGLAGKDVVGSVTVELERLLEKKEGDTQERVLSLELRQSPSDAMARASFSAGPRRSSAGLSAQPSVRASSAATPNYTTLVLSRPPSSVAPSSSASQVGGEYLGSTPSGAVSPAAALAAAALPQQPMGPSVYGVPQAAAKTVLAPAVPRPEDDHMTASHEEFLRRQAEEVAAAARRGAKPIEPTAIPRGGRYELGPSQTANLSQHQANQRMCSMGDDGCIIA